MISKKKYFIILLRKELEKLIFSEKFQISFHIIYFKGPTKDIEFNDFNDPETLFDDIKSRKIRFEDVEKNQIEFESKLSSIRIGTNKPKKQLSEMENITKFYKSREEVIKSYNDYFKMVHKAAYDSKHGKDSKY